MEEFLKKQVTVFLAFLLLTSSAAIAQSGVLSGKVKDTENNPIPGVNILIEGTTNGVSTDFDGIYYIENVPVGEQTVRVSYIGFKNIQSKIVIVEGETATLNFTMEEDAQALDEVMVTATRRSTNVQSTAAAITAVSGVELQKLGKTSVSQFLDAVPGVTFENGSANTNRIIFRGIATSTQEAGSPTATTYFDEFSVTPIFTGGATPLRLVDMERVEVLKGPQGTLFGRSAMSGIIRYISNKPSTKRVFGGIDTYLSSTTDGGFNYGGHGFVNVPIAKNLAVRAVAFTYQNSGFIDNVELNKPDGNDENTLGGRVALRWNVTDYFDIDVTYLNQSIKAAADRVSTTRDPGDLLVSGDEGPDIPFNIKERTQIGGVLSSYDLKHQFLNLKMEYEFNSFTAMALATRSQVEDKFVFDQREFVNVRSGCVCEDDRGSIENSDLLEFRLVSSKKDAFLDWIGGIYYENSDRNERQFNQYNGPDNSLFGVIPLTNDAPPLFDTETRTTSRELSVFGEIGLNLSPNSRFLLGYRRSNVKFGTLLEKGDGTFPAVTGASLLTGIPFDTEENVNTYKFSFEQKFNDDIFGYALASSGFRRGGFNPPTAISEFSTFKSDKLWNYELGVKTSWFDKRLIANLSAFHVAYTDIQLVVQDPVTFARLTGNVGQAAITGVELGFQYRLNEYWRFGFTASFNESMLKEDVPPSIIDPEGDPNDPDNFLFTGRDGDRLPGSARKNYSYSVNYSKPISDQLNLTGSIFTRYVGDRLNDFNLDLDVELPSYTLTDFRLGIDHGKGWAVALFANNIFDEAIVYSIDRQGASFESVPTNRPRTVGVNLRYNFK